MRGAFGRFHWSVNWIVAQSRESLQRLDNRTLYAPGLCFCDASRYVLLSVGVDEIFIDIGSYVRATAVKIFIIYLKKCKNIIK